MVDSTDIERMDESMGAEHSSKEELYNMLKEDELRDAVLLIYANKQDLPNALKPQQIVQRFQLDTRMHNRKWFVQPCVATTGINTNIYGASK